MLAPLYDVKNKLSEYVKIAESGEPVEICKRGEPTVVMVRKDDFTPKGQTPESIFWKVHNRWLERTGGGLTEEEYNEFMLVIEEGRNRIEPERPNPWLE